MFPHFLPDAFVISIKHPYQKYQKNEVVLVEHATYGKMIKRILSTSATGVWLVGDHFDSLSTEKMGLLDKKHILGKVVYQIKPKSNP